MAGVTGIGGVFFKSEDPIALRNWYKEKLGIDSDEYGKVFLWNSVKQPGIGRTIWAPFKEETTYFEPSQKQFMINFRVDDLVELAEELQTKGVEILAPILEESYGKFAHILDLEGNKIELWEPIGENILDLANEETS
ncbi:VOC family protein [Paenisporosarcina sp. FSL H8-0542]|uniref:VOC family protein n=1 Tax=Paenisporosarcina sp. FSL H8-0542 TaxID=2921401 RepID=UPI00315ABA08